MFIAVIIFHVIASLVLIFVVLLQTGKGAGIANVFGGAGQTVFGARTGDVLARATEICAGMFMITSLGLAMMSSDRSSSVMRRRHITQEQPMPLSPAQEAAQKQAMDKMKQALAGIAQTMKQAASPTSSTQKTSAVPSAEVAPGAQPTAQSQEPATEQKPSASSSQPANASSNTPAR